MKSEELKAIIRQRRQKFHEAQLWGSASDPMVQTAAGVSRAISDEYDSLIAEIDKLEKAQEQG